MVTNIADLKIKATYRTASPHYTKIPAQENYKTPATNAITEEILEVYKS